MSYTAKLQIRPLPNPGSYLRSRGLTEVQHATTTRMIASVGWELLIITKLRSYLNPRYLVGIRALQTRSKVSTETHTVFLLVAVHPAVGGVAAALLEAR